MSSSITARFEGVTDIYLREGATVSYVLGRSGKGPQAEDVDLVE